MQFLNRRINMLKAIKNIKDSDNGKEIHAELSNVLIRVLNNRDTYSCNKTQEEFFDVMYKRIRNLVDIKENYNLSLIMEKVGSVSIYLKSVSINIIKEFKCTDETKDWLINFLSDSIDSASKRVLLEHRIIDIKPRRDIPEEAYG